MDLYDLFRAIHVLNSPRPVLPIDSRYFPYYPIGNSFSTDVTLGCQAGNDCDILLAGCGDIRNVLHTLQVLAHDTTGSLKKSKVSFHLNDIEIGILARDLILLYLAHTIDPSNTEDMKFLWAVWYEVTLSEGHKNRLTATLSTLMNIEDGTHGIYFGNEQTRLEIREALKLWQDATMSAEETVEKRREFLVIRYDENFPDRATERVSSKLLRQFPLRGYEEIKERYKSEVKEYILEGRTKVNGSLPSHKAFSNMTFFRPGFTLWQVEDNCAPFMCYNLGLELERFDGQKTFVSTLCMEVLRNWITTLQGCFKQGMKIHVYFWFGNAIDFNRDVIPAEMKFDFIDTSNIADRVGLFPLLVYLQKRLKRDSGMLRTEVFHWCSIAPTMEEFLSQCLDIPPMMYPTVLGLHLAEELSLGHEQVEEFGSHVGIGKLTLRWRVAGSGDALTTISTDGVSKAIEEIENPKNPHYTVDDQLKTAVLCGKDVRDLMKGRVKSNLEDNTHSKNTEFQKKVYEFTDHYKVVIETDPQSLKCGELNITQTDDAWNKATICMTTNEKTMSAFSVPLCVQIAFSCGINVNSSHIKLSRKKGYIECRIDKDVETTFGERLLPFKPLPSNTVSQLQDYPRSDFAVQRLKFDNAAPLMSNPSCLTSRSQEKSGSVEKELYLLLDFFLRTVPMQFELPLYMRIDRANCEDIYCLDHLKVFEGRATVFITWYNMTFGERLCLEGKIDHFEFMAVSSQELHVTKEDVKQEVRELLQKILRLNSCRMDQELPVDRRWKTRTFFRARYQFSHGIVTKQHVPPSAPKEQHPQSSNEVPPESVPVPVKCVTCGVSENCRKCTGCRRVSYCSRDCQKKDWPQHKTSCSKK